MKKEILLSILLFFCIFSCLQAQNYNTQEGYIIPYQNDTIFGLIKEQTDLSEKILFKPKNSPEFREYTPAEIGSFYYAGGYYYKAVQIQLDQIQAQKLFLLTLAEGRVSLYKHKDVFYVQKDSLYKLEKKDVQVSPSVLKVDRRYIGLLTYLMSDCRQVERKIERTNFEATSLIKIVTLYNQCVDPGKTVVYEKPARTKVRLGARIGTTASTAHYFVEQGAYYKGDPTSGNGFTGGLLFNISYKNKFSAQPELLLTQKKSFITSKVNSFYNEKASFSITYLQLPVSFYYKLPTKRIRPFISAGGVVGYALSKQVTSQLISISSAPSPTAKKEVEVDKDEYGFRGGAGIAYSISDKSDIGIEYVFERSLTNRISVLDKIRTLSHNVTVRVSF